MHWSVCKCPRMIPGDFHESGAKHSPPGDPGTPDCPGAHPPPCFPGPPLTQDISGPSQSNEGLRRSILMISNDLFDGISAMSVS